MKTPLDPLGEDLAVALAGDRPDTGADRVQSTKDAGGCAKDHIHDACSDVQMLSQIEDALKRLAYGTYGLCVACGREISLKRLDENPAVETCSSCEQGPIIKAN